MRNNVVVCCESCVRIGRIGTKGKEINVRCRAPQIKRSTVYPSLLSTNMIALHLFLIMVPISCIVNAILPSPVSRIVLPAVFPPSSSSCRATSTPSVAAVAKPILP